jgi:Asp-tRNA(Asn)/Glu-tRNA(Gln) amidotransferase A subunit family amidase
VITLLRDSALARARQADQDIAAGKYRGPLHGIPWGAKDLVDTAGVATTYGAEPFRNRVPTTNATVVQRLEDAGAILIAKLSLGALALNDIWFGGQTMNPWLLEEGASGSSAGPGAATAAGLVGFSIGSETGGSIISPSMRCGITGLRPTYGRVPRTGAMTLCWSLDKLGPMTRTVEDAMLVLRAISGPDAGDVASVPSRLDYDATQPVTGLRVGYFPKWMTESPATDVDRAALDALRTLGLTPTEVSMPDWPYGSLNVILFAEGADSERPGRPAQGPGARCVAQPVSGSALSVGCRFRASRPAPEKSRPRDGPGHDGGRSPLRAVAPRRDAHHRQLHGASVAHAAGGIRGGQRSAE